VKVKYVLSFSRYVTHSSSFSIRLICEECFLFLFFYKRFVREKFKIFIPTERFGTFSATPSVLEVSKWLELAYCFFSLEEELITSRARIKLDFVRGTDGISSLFGTFYFGICIFLTTGQNSTSEFGRSYLLDLKVDGRISMA